MATATLSVRRQERTERNAFREPVRVHWFELRCPTCQRWTAIEPVAILGEAPFVCPTLGCAFRIQRELTPWVQQAEEAWAKEASKVIP